MIDAGRHSLLDEDITARCLVCRDTIRLAGQRAAEGFRARTSGEFELKGPQDFLTETDLAVEELIRERITTAFPDDGFLGEETGGEVEGNYWVVDPIDGTANFARGIPHYCVSIAFVSERATQIGAIFNPEMDDFYFARRAHGATLNDVSISVAGTSDVDAATFEIGWSNRVPNDMYLEVVAALYEAGANVRRSASGALGLAFVADGRSDGYAELHMNSWDCLAGLLLVEESGGVVGGFVSSGPLHAGGAVLAACPLVADHLSKATAIPPAG